MIIFAAIGIVYSLLYRMKRWNVQCVNYSLLRDSEFWRRVVSIVTLVLLLATSGLQYYIFAWNIRPLISEKQLEAIEQLREYTENDAYVLGTSFDAPWLLGWSERRVIAPGLFEWNVHNEEEWMNFLATTDPAAAEEFLDAYVGPIYIYYSKNYGNYLDLDKFEGHNFQKLRDNEAIVYRYLGR
jgi:hypothetical protein